MSTKDGYYTRIHDESQGGVLIPNKEYYLKFPYDGDSTQFMDVYIDEFQETPILKHLDFNQKRWDRHKGFNDKMENLLK